MGLKGIVGFGALISGVFVVYTALDFNKESRRGDTAMSVKSPAEVRPRHRPVQAMNMALGDMVFFAQDLGFEVKTTQDGALDARKIAARIEGELQNLREIYRQESASHPMLAGSAVLEIKVAPAGTVSDVREISSSMTDADFAKRLLAEVHNWSFAGIVTEPSIVKCPLLFVREGMDITTLVHWEKARNHATAKSTAVPPPVAVKQAAAPAFKAAKQPQTVTAPRAPEEAKIFQLKYPTSLRKDPNFSSTALATLAVGTQLAVVRSQGDWLVVKAAGSRPSGYVRKEFAVPLEAAE